MGWYVFIIGLIIFFTCLQMKHDNKKREKYGAEMDMNERIEKLQKYFQPCHCNDDYNYETCSFDTLLYHDDELELIKRYNNEVIQGYISESDATSLRDAQTKARNLFQKVCEKYWYDANNGSVEHKNEARKICNILGYYGS